MNAREKITTNTPDRKGANSACKKAQRAEISLPTDSPIGRILHLQKTIGNQAVQRLLKAGVLQAKLKIGQPNDIYEQEADRVAGQVMRMFGPIIERQPVEREELLLAQQQQDHHRLIDNWYNRCITNLGENALHARMANQRFIEFEESGISQLKTTGSIGTGVAYLFGTQGAIVALCIMVLTEVAAQNLSNKEAKIASAAKKIEDKLAIDKKKTDSRKRKLDNQIDSMSSLDWSEWSPLWNAIANLGVPKITPENIIYRDLLLAFAAGGGYNISGSQWNVENMSLFGKAPWYHSWDWGSPGWTNGQDIADELNALAEGDPSTRKTVSINPP